MNANEVIDSYVADVATRLPRRQRNDVAFELRALLAEELRDRAEAAGRDADATMAIEMARAFGRPADVAARYLPTLTIIDPADGRAFLRATVIGMAIVWTVGLLQMLQQPLDTSEAFLGALGQWWGGTVVGSLWWPGVLVVGFGLASWARRRGPRTSDWKPRSGDVAHASRAALVLGIIGTLCGVSVLTNPPWVLDFFWDGRAAASAYSALTYTDEFQARQGPILLVLLLLNVPLLAAAIRTGQRSATLRRIEFWLGMATCAAMLWSVLGGPIFLAAESDQMMKLAMTVIAALMLIGTGVRRYRAVRPAPG